MEKYNCTLCDISVDRQHIVWGSGALTNPIMIIGEAPGYSEDKYGVPFVGRSGKLLFESLELFGIERRMTYVTNIIKCRPTDNRAPSIVEISNCMPFIKHELSSTKAKIILLLGSTAIRYILNKNISVANARKKVIRMNNSFIIPTYHPSYILRNKDKINEFYDNLYIVSFYYKMLYNQLHKLNKNYHV